jgi:hypothetical protein
VKNRRGHKKSPVRLSNLSVAAVSVVGQSADLIIRRPDSKLHGGCRSGSGRFSPTVAVQLIALVPAGAVGPPYAAVDGDASSCDVRTLVSDGA